MRFVNQPITDILLALAEVSGRSMVPDETVRGDASYYFAETDFDTALRLFLETYKLYVRREGSVYYVSRIRTEWEPGAGLITMHAEDVEIPLLLRAASRAMGRTILFDPLPGERLTVHADAMAPQKLLEIILRRFPDYKVEADASFFYVKREARPAQPPPAPPARRRPPAPGGDQARGRALRDQRAEGPLPGPAGGALPEGRPGVLAVHEPRHAHREHALLAPELRRAAAPAARAGGRRLRPASTTSTTSSRSSSATS